MKNILTTLTILASLAPAFCHASIAEVSRVGVFGGSGASSITTGTFNAVAGNMLYVWVDWQNLGGSNSVTDTAGNTFTQIGTPQNVGGETNYISQFYAQNIKGNASDAVTMHTASGPFTDYSAGAAYQFSGASKTGALDNFNFGTSTTAFATTNTITVSGTKDVIVAAGEGAGKFSLSRPRLHHDHNFRRPRRIFGGRVQDRGDVERGCYSKSFVNGQQLHLCRRFIQVRRRFQNIQHIENRRYFLYSFGKHI